MQPLTLPLLLLLAAAAAVPRCLAGPDAWAVAVPCPHAPTASNSQADSFGRLWGFSAAGNTSCAFKDAQQQSIHIGAATPKQAWASAPACPAAEPPSNSNSAPDELGRLWGVSWGKCVPGG